MQEQLRHVLTSNAVRVIDLFREWDEDGDGTVSKKEFRKAMPMLGLEVSKQDINALFDSWDPDGSGMLELGELNKVQAFVSLYSYICIYMPSYLLTHSTRCSGAGEM